MSLIMLPALYYAWSYQGHDRTNGVLSDEKSNQRKVRKIVCSIEKPKEIAGSTPSHHRLRN